MAAGFVRPHLPFSVPRRYWDLHDPAGLPQPQRSELPTGAPAVAGKRGGEISNYAPVPESGAISEQLQRELIHGYYASVSYVDAQIGRVLDELSRLQLDRSTIVVLWGDHGFHLGDLGIWTKHTNYEQANHIPLLISIPGYVAGSTRQLAESVDLYPTLAALAGLPQPELIPRLDGVSLLPVLRAGTERVRDHAYHVFPKAQLGRAIRTERYRMVEWRKVDAEASTSEYELYDYESDPLETRNLAKECPAVVAELQQILSRYPRPLKP